MTLGDWVRVVRTFASGFSPEKSPHQEDEENRRVAAQLTVDLNVRGFGFCL